MKCSICRHGDTAPGHTTVTVERNGTIIIVRDVPAEIYSQCGEYYLDETISIQVLSMANSAIQHHAEVGILRFAA